MNGARPAFVDRAGSAAAYPWRGYSKRLCCRASNPLRAGVLQEELDQRPELAFLAREVVVRSVHHGLARAAHAREHLRPRGRAFHDRWKIVLGVDVEYRHA